MTKNSQPDITKSHSNENGKERWDERRFLPIVGEKESERNKEKKTKKRRGKNEYHCIYMLIGFY